MTDRQRIQDAINEMLGFAGGALSVRTLASIVGQFLERTDSQVGDALTLAEFNDYLLSVEYHFASLTNKFFTRLLERSQ